MKTRHKIIFGDSRNMGKTTDESVHLVVTSPPYWQLKDYGNGNQIGYNDTYEEYINNLNLVWSECHRVLHNGCRLCINIGDQFARSVYYGRYKIIPIRTEIIKFCETIGFDYMGAIIWQKVTTCNTSGGATIMGSYPFPRNGILKLDYEFILLFKKNGKPPKASQEMKLKSKLTNEEWNSYFAGHWNFAGEKQDRHLAMFPVELPKRLIKMFSYVGDTVLDPFLGSGTTTLAARNLNRNSIGYEINHDFLPLINDKLHINQRNILKDASFDIIEDDAKENNFNDKILNLPYIFKDTVSFERKIDPKKLRFGSKIDDIAVEKNDFFTVKQILSPEILILNGGLKIKLLGIKEKPGQAEAAIDFLRKKTNGQKVFLKFDQQKYDDKDNLLCYLFLKNKTFINAHLIKNKLADIDNSMDFKYKHSFQNKMAD
jgi:DNA modification methylase